MYDTTGWAMVVLNINPFMLQPTIGICYDTYADYEWQEDDPPDADAEFEPESTVEAIEEAIEHCGFRSERIGTARELYRQLCKNKVWDAAINITESAGSRNREAYAPILLEMAGIPCVGADALSLSVSLDKAWTKTLVQAAGVRTPPFTTYRNAAEVTTESLPAPFPLFVKPRYEGTSKGITEHSKVSSIEELRRVVNDTVTAYKQDAIVEAFIEGGGEFTVAVIGNDPPDALPALQRAVEPTTGIGVHALEHRGMPEHDWPYELRGILDDPLEQELQRQAVLAYKALECKDFARADFRVDDAGAVWFLEINPLPSFAPDDTFAISAELMGMEYPTFLGDVFSRAFKRLGVS